MLNQIKNAMGLQVADHPVAFSNRGTMSQQDIAVPHNPSLNQGTPIGWRKGP